MDLLRGFKDELPPVVIDNNHANESNMADYINDDFYVTLSGQYL